MLLHLCLFLAATMTARAQFQLQSWTTDDGLPQNTVHSILQTPDGYLWLATLDGLVRYDGVRFTVFNKNNSQGIVSNRFTQTIIDARGDLWVGTESSGITRYRNGKFQTFTIDAVTQKKPIWKLTLNADGELVAFIESGIFRWNGESFVPLAPVAGETKTSHVLWGKSGAFYYTDGQTLHRIKENRHSSFLLPGRHQEVTRSALFEDSRARLWVGTTLAGLLVLDGDKLTRYTMKDGLPSLSVTPRIEDRDGNLWAVTNGDAIAGLGAVVVSPAGKISRLTAKDGLSDDSLSAIHQDREGNIWLGTFFRGLNRLSPQSVKFYSTKDGLAADVAHSIYQTDDGDVWIGGKRTTRWNENRLAPFAGGALHAEGAVTAIEQDRSGRIWFGHWGGAYYLENDKVIDFSANLGLVATVTDIHEDRSGALWFASSEGLFHWQHKRMTRFTMAQGLPSNDVKIIHESPDGTLWIGTYGGLARFSHCQVEISRCPIQAFTVADGLASNLVRSIYQDRDGVMWIGSYDGGLTRLKDSRFTRYTSGDGLFNDGVFQILEDERGNLWMSCNRGIYRVAKRQLNDFAENKIPRIESIAYGKADGLLETECNGGQQPAGTKTRDGKLWFPTQRGVAVIDPNSITTNSYPPPVRIESLALNGTKSFTTNDVLEVSPEIENVEIAYTGLSFVKPEQIRFRYKLTGLDSDWIDADTRRTAYYSHLPAGEYTFTVIAANADGVWNTLGANLRVRVRPPFYRTWWFIVAGVIGTFGLVIFFYQRRVARLKHERGVQAAFSRRLIESQERERTRIAAELHDGLSQSLVIIKNRAVLSLTTPDNTERAFEQMEEISVAASEAMFEAKEIIYDLRPIQLDRFGLTRAVNAMLKKVGDAHELKFEIDIENLDGMLTKEAESNLYRMLQESINNIVRHSRATSAQVSLARQNDFVTLTIADNGKGFEASEALHKEQRAGGFGLLGIAERARLLNGHAEIRSAVDSGTRITISLPVTKNLAFQTSNNESGFTHK